MATGRDIIVPTGAGNRTVEVLGNDVQVVEYRGSRVVTFKQVDDLHKKAEGQASVQFRRHRDRYIEGVDFVEMASDQFDRNLPEGIVSKYAPSVILLTERGYGKICKGWNDDRSWALHDAMQDAYFQLQGEPALVSGYAAVNAELVAVRRDLSVTREKLDAVLAYLECTSTSAEATAATVRELQPEIAKSYIAANRITTAAMVTSGEVVALAGISNRKGLRGLARRVGNQLEREHDRHNVPVRYDSVGLTRVRKFDFGIAKAWLASGGAQLVHMWAAEARGQGALNLRVIKGSR